MHGLVEARRSRTAAGVAAALVAAGAGVRLLHRLRAARGRRRIVYFGAAVGTMARSRRTARCALAAGLSVVCARAAVLAASVAWRRSRDSPARRRGVSVRRRLARLVRFLRLGPSLDAAAARHAGTKCSFPGSSRRCSAGAGAWLGLRGSLTGPRAGGVDGARLRASTSCSPSSRDGWRSVRRAASTPCSTRRVPLFSFIRAAGRFGVVSTLATAVLMAMMLGTPRPHRTRAAGRRAR